MHMKSMLLAAAGALAAVVLSSAPAQGREFRGGSAPVVGQQGFACNGFVRDGRSFHSGDRMRDRRAVCNSDVVMDVYGGEWALYNNRTWDSDSYNDWWHDRPDRAYPAWMRHNEGCQRMWFAGDTLRC
jgi:hypothetical protein